MNLTVIFEIVILLIIVLMSSWGYRRGLFLLVAKPFSFLLSLAFTVLIYRGVVSETSSIAERLSLFLIILILSRLLCGRIIAIISKIFDIGIIGSINRLSGMVLSFCFAALIAWLFIYLSDKLMSPGGSEAEFEGGRLYRFFLELSPFNLLLKF